MDVPHLDLLCGEVAEWWVRGWGRDVWHELQQPKLSHQAPTPVCPWSMGRRPQEFLPLVLNVGWQEQQSCLKFSILRAT